jgi:hypothetical protein
MPLDLVVVERDRVVLKAGETVLELEPEDVKCVKQCNDKWYVEYTAGRASRFQLH